MCPAYMTCTRSTKPATMPRSWVIQMNGHTQLIAQVLDQVDDLRLDGHVQRRGGLVGR